MPIEEVNGIEINYSDTGGDGPVVVLSHGILMDQSLFDPQVRALSPDYRVITWDERGYGSADAAMPVAKAEHCATGSAGPRR